MIVTVNVKNNFDINYLSDLKKLNMEGIKINKSELSRHLGVSRTTVKKYINGFTPTKKRCKKSKLDKYYLEIEKLLYKDNKGKIFHYKSNLYNYCIENNIIEKVSLSTFKYWIYKNSKINDYFKSSINKKAQIRFETELGEQAQLDWKENVKIILKDNKEIEINIFVLILSHSRFRYYGVSLSKSQEILFHFLDNAFEAFGGVPKSIITDNMKTVMDVSRTEYNQGKINNKFKQFSDDYGFETKPCLAGRPQTKAKVEQPMRILDYLQAFNGDLTYDELINKVEELNEKENNRYHHSYGMIPRISLQKEKDFLLPLPRVKIRNHYQIATTQVTVDNSCLISYKSNKYSVPTEYLNKKLLIQVYENKLHIYFNTKLVTVHSISNKKGQIFYEKEHYTDILTQSKLFEGKDISKIAQENLEKIGAKTND